MGKLQVAFRNVYKYKLDKELFVAVEGMHTGQSALREDRDAHRALLAGGVSLRCRRALFAGEQEQQLRQSSGGHSAGPLRWFSEPPCCVSRVAP